jgi:hypothetical protein
MTTEMWITLVVAVLGAGAQLGAAWITRKGSRPDDEEDSDKHETKK